MSHGLLGHDVGAVAAIDSPGSLAARLALGRRPRRCPVGGQLVVARAAAETIEAGLAVEHVVALAALDVSSPAPPCNRLAPASPRSTSSPAVPKTSSTPAGGASTAVGPRIGEVDRTGGPSLNEAASAPSPRRARRGPRRRQHVLARRAHQRVRAVAAFQPVRAAPPVRTSSPGPAITSTRAGRRGAVVAVAEPELDVPRRAAHGVGVEGRAAAARRTGAPASWTVSRCSDERDVVALAAPRRRSRVWSRCPDGHG